MSTKQHRGGSHLRAADEFKALKLIEANGRVEDGCWHYNPGWSDFKIALEIGCAEITIARRRTKVFGALKRGPNGDSTAHQNLSADLASIKSELRSQSADTHTLRQRVEALEKSLNLILSGAVNVGLPVEVDPLALKDLQKHFSRAEP